MYYHDIKHDDMNNGDGLRVTLFVSGCSHHCDGCQNPETWNPSSGIEFDEAALNEILDYLSKDYISGLTLSGGDPLNINNLRDIENLCKIVKERFPDKSIWIYTGYTFEEILYGNNEDRRRIIREYCDVLVDGRFEKKLADVNYHWAGSTNQRVIDFNNTFFIDKIVEIVGVEKMETEERNA